MKAVIVGSYILYLTSLLDKNEQVKGSTIGLVNWILRNVKGIKLKQKKDIVLVADNSWKTVLEEFKNDNISIAISIVIETLYFNHQKEMDNAYGQELGNRVVRFTEKQSVGNINDYAKDSYMIADKLTQSVRKSVFDYLTYGVMK